MKIAIVNSIKAYGGGEKWVLRAASGFQARGHAVTVLGHPGGDLDRRCAGEGIPFRGVRLRHDISPAAVTGLARELRVAGPEAVIFCNERAARVGVLAAGPAGLAKRRVPLVYRNGLLGSFKNKAHNRLLVAPRIARWVTNATSVRDELLSYGWIPKERAHVIYNGVDPSPVEAADATGLREELGAGDEDIVFLSAARLVPEKGHALLLECFAEAAARSPRLRLWIAGEGPEGERLRARAAELGLGERVSWLGFRSDIPRLLRASDALCHASEREGAPNIVLEAMVAGLPVVGVAAPGTVELALHRETALLAPPGDAGGLRQYVETLAGDAALRRCLGDAGRDRALTEFTEGRSTDRWLELLWKATQDA